MPRLAAFNALVLAGAVFVWGTAAAAPPQPPPADKALAHDIFKQLIEIRSTDTIGTRAIADAIVARLKEAGFPAADIHELAEENYPNQVSVVVRFRGKGLEKPILWNGHIDVVDAKAEDWTVPPFAFTEEGGYYYGRGTADMKDQDTAVLESLIRLKREGFMPDRDIIAAFTADEEGNWDMDGMWYLLRAHRALVDAGIAVNPDGDSGEIDHGQRLDFGVETGEKTYVTFTFEVTNKGGHSSEPRPDNAIYELADGLVRLSKYAFPFKTNATTRAYFATLASLQTGQRRADYLALSKAPVDVQAAGRLSADVPLNAILHSTCVATMLDAGVQENALAARATATVQCRIMPDETTQTTRAALAKAVADPSIKIAVLGKVLSAPETVPDPRVMETIGSVVHAEWPGVPVMPDMAAGASDSIFTRNFGIPSYGVSGSWGDINDVRMHGRDERIAEDDFYESVEFTYRLMKALTAVTPRSGP